MSYGIKIDDNVTKLSKYKNTGYKRNTLSELLKGLLYFSNANKFHSYKFNGSKISMMKKLSSCKEDGNSELTLSRIYCDRRLLKEISDNQLNNQLKKRKSNGRHKKILTWAKILNKYNKYKIYKRK